MDEKKWLIKTDATADFKELSKLGTITYVSKLGGLCKTVCFSSSSSKETIEQVAGVISASPERKGKVSCDELKS